MTARRGFGLVLIGVLCVAVGLALTQTGTTNVETVGALFLLLGMILGVVGLGGAAVSLIRSPR